MNKPEKDCILRRGHVVLGLPDTQGNRSIIFNGAPKAQKKPELNDRKQHLEGHDRSNRGINKAKKFCLELMKKGYESKAIQIRKA